jgi:hypothetical protein
MRNYRNTTTSKTITFFLLVLLVLFGVDSVMQKKPTIKPSKAEATYQFNPTAGTIVTGSNPTILGLTTASGEGVNMGDWRGALADDNLHFGITSTNPGGYNAYLDLGGVELNGANKMIIQTEFDLDATVPSTLVQICDWVSSTGVDSAADSECTGGGWRNLNINDTAITTGTATAYDWEIYNGYWDATATTSINTPLSNFVDGTVGVRIRYYSSTNTTSVVHIDYLRAYAVVNPIYSPSGVTQTSGGTLSGNYINTILGGTGQTGSENTRLVVPGTAGSISDFYFTFSDVRTYIGANTILVRAEYVCNTTGINHRPKIYNFRTAAWEDLTTASIACSATEVTNGWAKNATNIADYIEDGAVRVGWYGLSNGTQSIQIDRIHIMIGTTNSDGLSEISFGSNSANSVTNTRDLDMTGTSNTWSILSADKSNTQAFATYGLDSDNTTTAGEASAANINFDVTVPHNTVVAGTFFASRHMSGVAGTVQVGMRDFSGLTGTVGGWTALGATGATTQVYTDNITVGGVANGGAAGLVTNPEDYVDTLNNRINLRLRTPSPGGTANNSVAQWDFAMVSIQWVEDPDHASATYQFHPTGGGIVTGSNPAILGLTAASTEGVNMGDWRGALADDNLHFGITSTPSGYNAYLDIGNVQLNGANKMIIQTEFDLDATIPTTLVQICDWVSSTGVHAAADSQCTGGGWRNLNVNDAVINTATPTTYDWQIYNGYWDSSATARIDTPLSNFVRNASSTVRIRYYSTTNTSSLVNIDYLRVFPVINPIYSASGATQISGGAITGNYSQTAIGVVGQSSADNVRFNVPGTAGSVSDFYLSFTDVKTYTGANTIMVRAEYSCSAIGINHRPKIYNFNTTSWEDLTTASIACNATDAANMWAKNNVTISDYVSNGEIRVGWRGLSNGTQAIQIDYIYLMLGTTNTDGTSEISFGSNSANSITNTRDLDVTGTSNTWSIATADKSNTQAFASYALDGDNTASAGEASSANADFDVTVPTNAAVTGIFFSSRHMAGTAGTVQLAVKDYSGFTGTTGGWTPLGAGATTGQVYTDNITIGTVVATGGVAGLQNNPEDYVDTVNNKMNLKLRTSTAGGTANNSVRQWDFAMVSIQWIEVPFVETVSFSISDTSVGFGTLSSAATRYATGDTLGTTTSSEIAHTLTASTDATGGYVISVSGTTLTCDACGGETITEIGSTAAAPSAGTEQFGLRIATTTGNGTLYSPYNTSLFAYATSSFPQVIASGDGDTVVTTYPLRYLTNISGLTGEGDYSAAVTYTVTGTF